jgi:hypothetical protein
MDLNYVAPLVGAGIGLGTYVLYKRYSKPTVKTDDSLEGTELQPIYKNIVHLGGKSRKLRKWKLKTRRA